MFAITPFIVEVSPVEIKDTLDLTIVYDKTITDILLLEELEKDATKRAELRTLYRQRIRVIKLAVKKLKDFRTKLIA